MALPDLIHEVERFRQWARSFPPEQRRGEWECEYDDWGSIYDAALHFVAVTRFEDWSAQQLEAMLFAIARDNELQHLASEIRCHNPDVLLCLARAAVQKAERDAKWQLAEELGQLGKSDGEEQRLLLTLVRDEDEYVRRRSLGALACIGSPAVETLAVAEWNRVDQNQEWMRMEVLWCLHRIGSPLLEKFVSEAECDQREYLRGYAGRVRRGHVDP